MYVLSCTWSAGRQDGPQMSSLMGTLSSHCFICDEAINNQPPPSLQRGRAETALLLSVIISHWACMHIQAAVQSVLNHY
jgi:hypothetical protein